MCSSRRMASSCRSFWFVPVLTAALVAATAAPVISQGTRLWNPINPRPVGKRRSGRRGAHQRRPPAPGAGPHFAGHDAFHIRMVGRGGQKRPRLPGNTVARNRAARGGESRRQAVHAFREQRCSVQVVRLGPDGSLYAATLPSGKVYKLNADATTKQDDTNATLVFDMSKLPAAKAGIQATDKQSKPHYIWDLTFDKDRAALHCHRRSCRDLSRRC